MLGIWSGNSGVRYGANEAGRDYGVTVEAACKRWSARMQMLGQEECNRVVKSVQLRKQTATGFPEDILEACLGPPTA